MSEKPTFKGFPIVWVDPGEPMSIEFGSAAQIDKSQVQCFACGTITFGISGRPVHECVNCGAKGVNSPNITLGNPPAERV